MAKTNPDSSNSRNPSITGKLTKKSGELIDKAKISLIDKSDKVIKEIESDKDGSYIFNNLSPDTYAMKIEKENFETVEVKEINLEKNKETTLDFTLNESVYVSSAKGTPWVGIAVWVFILGVIGYNYWDVGDLFRKTGDLQILARQSIEDNQIDVDGKLEFEGYKFDEMNVWAVITDEGGNKVVMESNRIDTSGHFTLNPVSLTKFGYPEDPGVLDVLVSGRIKVKGKKKTAVGTAYLQVNTNQLNILARLKKEGKEWVVDGKVLPDSLPFGSLNIDVIIKNGKGESYSPDVDSVFRENGKFYTKAIPGNFMNDSLLPEAEIKILATGIMNGDFQKKLYGKKILNMGSGRKIRTLNISITPFILLPLIFIISVVLAIVEFKEINLAFKYYSSIILAFIFTGFMIAYIVGGLRTVNRMGLEENEEVASLGVASIFYGTYVNDIEPQWLFSLTSPSEKDINGGASAISKGFGAPLWVILISVIGAGLFTINIIVEGIKDRVRKMTVDKARVNIQKIILHEFYVFFSPVGAIFVYQLLVLGGAASQPVTVAIAVLAAGLALNLLLEKALELINKNLKSA